MSTVEALAHLNAESFRLADIQLRIDLTRSNHPFDQLTQFQMDEAQTVLDTRKAELKDVYAVYSTLG